MNAYITDSLAREHTNTLLADAAANRRAKVARRNRRNASAASATSSQPAAGRAHRHGLRSGTASAAHHLARPISSFQTWLAAGQL
jgi:hypothetical protein